MPTLWETRAEPIPGYRLIERLGRGGFGEVWKAEAPGGLTKAIKFVSGTIGADKDRSHAEQELKALSRVRGIRHPFILSMERFDVIDGQLIIVMELADRNLDDRLKECRQQGLTGIPRTELLKYLTEAAEALDLMNGDYDLQHLDIKPQNLFLIGSHLKVADFGLVKDLEGCTAQVTGGVTPVYAPPETFDGWVSRNSDQYSLAIVFQELLTSQRPFPGPSARQLMLQHLTAEPILESLPVADRAIVYRALSKDPQQRFESCAEFIEQLKSGSSVPRTNTTRVPMARMPAVLDEETDVEQDQTGNRSTRLSCKADSSLSARSTSIRSAPVFERSSIESSPDGVLRPTLVVGIGRTGQLLIERVRKQLTRQFGGESHWPAIRLLGIDSDPAVFKEVERSDPSSHDLHDQTLLCRFRKPNQYLKEWDSLKHLSSWLDPNALFQITSAGTTNSHRALGRLSLVDNYRRILARIRSEVETLLSSQVIDAARTATGHELRDITPRIFVAGSMAGGTGSGMFIDLCYLARRVLVEAGSNTPCVDGILFAGFEPGKGSDIARINHYALAQNLLDLSQPNVNFSVRYEADGEVDRFTQPPAQNIYFIDQMSESLSEPKKEVSLDIAADFIVCSSAKPLGKEMDDYLSQSNFPCFRSLGFFSLSFPRAALIRKSASKLLHRLIKGWLVSIPSKQGEMIRRQTEASLVDGGFDPQSIANRLLDAVNRQLPEPVHVLAAKEIASIEDDLKKADGSKQPQVMQTGVEKLKSLIGLDPFDDEGRLDEPPALDRILRDVTNSVAQTLFEPILDSLKVTLDQPGTRTATAKWALDGFADFFLHRADDQQEQTRLAQTTVLRRAKEIREKPPTKSFLLPATDAQIRLLEQYAKEKIECRIREQVVQVCLVIRAKLSDAAKDMVVVRQHLEKMEQKFESLFTEISADESGCVQTIFPGGTIHLDDAVACVTEGELRERVGDLEQTLQQHVIENFGGLWSACRSANANDEGGLADTLLTQATAWLSDYYPAQDAIEAFGDRHRGDPSGIRRELEAFLGWSAPTMVGRKPSKTDSRPPEEVIFFATPSTEQRDGFLETALSIVGDIPSRHATSAGEVGFCRVSGHQHLARMLPPWLLESKRLYETAVSGRLSPEIFPGLNDR